MGAKGYIGTNDEWTKGREHAEYTFIHFMEYSELLDEGGKELGCMWIG